MKNYDTNVLIIGGGLAGLSAALAARECGARTMLVCKSRAGRSGNTIVSGAGISVWVPDNTQGDSRDLYEADLLRSGAGINDRAMVRRVLSCSAGVLPFLEKYGVELRCQNSGKMVKRPGGHSAARYYSADFRGLSFQTRGLSLVRPLEAEAGKTGTKIMDRTFVLELIKRDDTVTGCRCLDLETGEEFCVQAGSVILASGGGASLFARTNNTVDVTCDSYRLALEAGARLRDMEFVQFYPCVCFGRVRLQIGSALFGEGAVLRNRDGEAFMQRYSQDGDRATRDAMAHAVQTEIAAGRGDPDHAYVDCSQIGREVIAAKYKELSDALSDIGIDIGKDLIPVEAAAHFLMGGICVDENWSTEVPGLYACGEAVGGLHGANRLPGAALMEAVVSGQAAGQNAAAFGREQDKRDRLVFPKTEAGNEAGDIDWKGKIKELRTKAWEDAGVIRSADSLARFEQYLDEQQGLLPLALYEMKNTRYAYEYRSYYLTAKALTASALARKESRGAHFRSDCPEKEEKYNGNFICSMDSIGELRTEFEPLKTE